MGSPLSISSGVSRHLVWFGRICGALSVVSLLSRAFNFGLADALAPFVHAWQSLVHVTIGWLLINLGLPAIWGDFFVLSSITIFIFYRGALRLGFQPLRDGLAGSIAAYARISIRVYADHLDQAKVPLNHKRDEVGDQSGMQSLRSALIHWEDAQDDKKAKPKEGRELTRVEKDALYDSALSSRIEALESNLVTFGARALLGIPIAYGIFLAACLIVEVIAPFMRPEWAGHNVFLSAAQTIPAVVLLAYFFGPLVIWGISIWAHLFRAKSLSSYDNGGLNDFPKFVWYETLILIIAVMVFFAMNAGFSLV